MLKAQKLTLPKPLLSFNYISITRHQTQIQSSPSLVLAM